MSLGNDPFTDLPIRSLPGQRAQVGAALYPEEVRLSLP